MSRPVPAVFFGSGAFAVPILDALADAPETTLLAVVTAPPKPAGRHRLPTETPVARRAVARGLPVHADPAVAGTADLIILADYGRLLPAAVVDTPRHGALNLHPSLLPRWRGATPVARAIAAGDAVTGVSLMRMDAGLDTGPLVAQRETSIEADETTPELEARLATMAAALLLDRLGPWLRGEATARPQPSEGASMARQFRRPDGRLDVGRPAAELERQVRAFQPWPGSFVDTPAGRLTLWRVRPEVTWGSGHAPPGTLVASGPGLVLVVGDGRLDLEVVQLAGGRRMTGAELRRGHPGLVGTVVAAAGEGSR
ncbi:MAG TPA: methionyl-tRNA formyltransferase [Candidatus Limnocylindrales bacterium]|jgi:methionyl-tRNA formyltransferase